MEKRPAPSDGAVAGPYGGQGLLYSNSTCSHMHNQKQTNKQYVIYPIGYVFTESCREGDSEHDSPKDEALQNISADDLPDSASQTAPPQDKSFSFRCLTLNTFFDKTFTQRFKSL